MKTAIILGATGLTGSILLDNLLNNPSYNNVIIFVRKSVGFTHKKLKEVICDVINIEEQKELFKANEVFCCIGTTAKKTPDKEVYKAIDYGIPVKCAQLCAENSIPRLFVISALGVNVNSSIFYNRTKGEMERDVLAILPNKVTFMQPSLILGNRGDVRVGEQIGSILMTGLSFLMVGPLKKYRAIQAETIANAMVVLAQQKVVITYVPSNEIQRIGGV